MAVIIDLYSRAVIGWSMNARMTAELTCKALQMALLRRGRPKEVIVHSDRGSQYCSMAYRNLIEKHQLIQSMSRKGNCWDNAVMERFFLNLKMERVWQRDYANHAEAQADIADYIVGFYNPIRLHSTLGYQSPNNYELQQEAARGRTFERVEAYETARASGAEIEAAVQTLTPGAAIST